MPFPSAAETTAGRAGAARPARRLTPPAKRALAEYLPPGVAAAAWELITGGLADDPWRVGKPLREPDRGLRSARRGTYRVIYRIDEDKHAIEIRSIRYRTDAYRT